MLMNDKKRGFLCFGEIFCRAAYNYNKKPS